ncbi:hypothetical protein RB595_009611 [Gaeumannomyces hyphopodioides]
MGNGNRAQQKRERNAKDQKGIKKSQLKVAKKIQCEICKVTFLSTIRGEELEQHSINKHAKRDMVECFPTYGQ